MSSTHRTKGAKVVNPLDAPIRAARTKAIQETIAALVRIDIDTLCDVADQRAAASMLGVPYFVVAMAAASTDGTVTEADIDEYNRWAAAKGE